MRLRNTNRRKSTRGNIRFSDRNQDLGPYKKHWQFFSFGNLGGFNDVDKKTSNRIRTDSSKCRRQSYNLQKLEGRGDGVSRDLEWRINPLLAAGKPLQT